MKDLGIVRRLYYRHGLSLSEIERRTGLTRKTVIDLARRRGVEVVERRIMPEELPAFSECFITGTAAEVTPVGEIGPHKYTPGALTATLIDDYTAEVQPKSKAA